MRMKNTGIWCKETVECQYTSNTQRLLSNGIYDIQITHIEKTIKFKTLRIAGKNKLTLSNKLERRR